MIAFDVGIPAFVPFVITQIVQIVELGESGPSCVADDDVETTERFYGFADAAFNVRDVACIALENCCFDVVLGFEFAGKFFRRSFFTVVVDGDIAAFCGEFASYFCSESSCR